ncbi:MAG: hypothetical protein ACLS95_05960 [Clostridia bacterium]
MKKQIKTPNAITLIALVITIIVLIILAGISISLLFGENGIITKAKETKELQKIAELTEKLELEKGPVALDHKGEVLITDYLEYIKEQAIIENKDIETLNELQSYITLEGEYVFLVEEKDNRDVKITYMGKPGELPPRITGLEMSSTTNSITVKVEGLRLENPHYTYYIKSEKEEEYGEKVGNNTTGSYTFEGLEQNHIYYLKVEVETAYGKSNKEGSKTTGTIEALTKENTTFTSTPEGWTNGIVKTKIETSVNGYTIQYSKDLVNWEKYSKEVESNKNEMLYARLTDGNNIGEYTSTQIKNIDTDKPEEAIMELSGAGTVTSNPSVKIKVTHTDKQSGVEVVKSKWVYNTNSNAIGESEASYTGGYFNSNGQEITLSMSGEGTYYLHVLTIDKAGNKRETISKAVSMVANKHSHTGSSSSGGGCYTTPVYHKHAGNTAGGGCYTKAVYHTHTGNSSTNGGCYITPIYHQHRGNTNTNGGCYTIPYYHYSYSTPVYCTGTLRYTGSSGTDHGEKWYKFKCDSCGATYNSYSSTGAVIGNGLKSVSCKEWFGTVISTKTEYADGYSIPSGATLVSTSYQVGCGKTVGSTVDGYTLGCGKTEGSTIDSYQLGCGKIAGSSIDSYVLGCGINNGQIVSYTVTY